jgi:hypothetical protein
MTRGAGGVCDVTAIDNAGWCWYPTPTSGESSNPWDKHEQIIAYYTNSLAPATVTGYNIVNTVLPSDQKGRLLTFTGTLNSNYFSGNRPGSDNFNTPDEQGTTDFGTSIPILRRGEVVDAVELEQLVGINLSPLRAGDYILIDPRDTNGGAHGLIVVGWGTFANCAATQSARRTIDDFSIARTTANTVPYVADFSGENSQSPTPRPFYCSMYNDQAAPSVGFFNRHNWHFYTTQDTITISPGQLYLDAVWSWTSNDGS